MGEEKLVKKIKYFRTNLLVQCIGFNHLQESKKSSWAVRDKNAATNRAQDLFKLALAPRGISLPLSFAIIIIIIPISMITFTITIIITNGDDDEGSVTLLKITKTSQNNSRQVDFYVKFNFKASLFFAFFDLRTPYFAKTHFCFHRFTRLRKFSFVAVSPSCFIIFGLF